MKENHYTFPLLFASRYVNDLLESLSIPRKPIVDSKGHWQWEQIGVGNLDKWQDEMMKKLKAVN